MIPKLTKEQAIVITGYTGIVCCNFSDFHEDVEERLGHPIWTHEFASLKVWDEIKKLYKDDFVSMAYMPEVKE